MSMRNETPDPLALSERSESNGIDALIDEAARRLVAGEPSSLLRRRVRDRIGKRQTAWSFVPALAGAAVLLVVAVIVGRALLGPVDRTLSGPANGSDIVATGERPTIERAAPAVSSQPADVTPIPPVRTTPRPLGRRLAADVPVPPPAEEESPIPPIAIEPLTTAQIAVDVSSGVMPIDIAPLQIEPLLGQ
jgi:hypothetical protein